MAISNTKREKIVFLSFSINCYVLHLNKRICLHCFLIFSCVLVMAISTTTKIYKIIWLNRTKKKMSDWICVSLFLSLCLFCLCLCLSFFTWLSQSLSFIKQHLSLSISLSLSEKRVVRWPVGKLFKLSKGDRTWTQCLGRNYGLKLM